MEKLPRIPLLILEIPYYTLIQAFSNGGLRAKLKVACGRAPIKKNKIMPNDKASCRPTCQMTPFLGQILQPTPSFTLFQQPI